MTCIATMEEPDERFEAQVLEQLDLFDDAARQEGIDEDWAAAELEVIDSFEDIAEDGTALSLPQVRCHASFCQADFMLDVNTADGLQSLQDVSPWGSETFIWVEDMEQSKGIIYFARDGFDLPGQGA